MEQFDLKRGMQGLSGLREELLNKTSALREPFEGAPDVPALSYMSDNMVAPPSHFKSYSNHKITPAFRQEAATQEQYGTQGTGR